MTLFLCIILIIIILNDIILIVFLKTNLTLNKKLYILQQVEETISIQHKWNIPLQLFVIAPTS